MQKQNRQPMRVYAVDRTEREYIERHCPIAKETEYTRKLRADLIIRDEERMAATKGNVAPGNHLLKEFMAILGIHKRLTEKRMAKELQVTHGCVVHIAKVLLEHKLITQFPLTREGYGYALRT